MTNTEQIPLGKQIGFASSQKPIHSNHDLQPQTISAIFAASPLRLSAKVCRLLNMRIEIETARLDAASWPVWRGAYYLKCSVEVIASEGN